jgi:hypothetical protein
MRSEDYEGLAELDLLLEPCLLAPPSRPAIVHARSPWRWCDSCFSLGCALVESLTRRAQFDVLSRRFRRELYRSTYATAI